MKKSVETLLMFDASALGKSLKETTVRTVKTDLQDIVTVWCHSDRGVDLFYWKDERENIIKQQMQFHGQIAEWNVIEGTRTGYVVEEDRDGQPVARVAYDATPMGLTVAQIVKILSEASELKEPLRTALMRNFEESRHFGLLSPREVLSLYGQKKTWRNLAMAWWDRIVYAIRFGR